MSYNYWVVVFPAVTIAAILLFYAYYLKAANPLSGTTEWITYRGSDAFSLSGRRGRLDRRDLLPIIIITAVYAVIAFLLLGSHDAPESFQHFDKAGDSVTIELREETPVSRIMYYTGLVHSSYILQLSADGESWETQTPAEGESFAMPQSYADLFKWQYANISTDTPVKFIRITAESSGMELGEIAIYLDGGALAGADDIAYCGAPALLDEQDIVPDAPSWYNSMIFDEIYHGRAAYEYLEGQWPYEATHPPLGKIIIMTGVELFGMNPFGWRFMGTLFGVLMLPLLYILLKWLFGKRAVAVCGTLLFAFDFMHYTQTRIATIDTYSVFFTILMYMFMYRFITEDYDAPLKKSLPWLFLSGLFFGVGAASTWTALYAGAGLAVIYAVHHVLVGIHYVKAGRGREYVRRLIATLLLSVVFFILIPAAIYCLSYIPYGLAHGMSVRGGMLWSSDYFKLIWENQQFMLSYHGQLAATHPYQSAWWQWILDIRPILYFSDTTMGGGLKSSISAFGNPLVWWGGLGAVIMLVWRTIKRRDGRALFILIGYFAALLPWVFISRCAFVYHYFPCALFLCLALSHVFDTILERNSRGARLWVFGYTAAAVLLFAAFYPVLSGVTVPRWYTTNFLRWLFLSWPV